MMDIETSFCFSIIFKPKKDLIDKIGVFFFDKRRLKDIKVESIETNIGDWLEPMSGNLPELFIGSTETGEYSVFFSNLPDGWSSAARMLSRLTSSRSIQIRVSNEICEFQLIDSGETLRIIQLIKEGKWKFFQKGKLLPYEDATTYKSADVRQRLNIELIREYLLHENIDLTSILDGVFTGIHLQVLSWRFL